eukprot:3244116-Ditylum_brightwellii.AAC.1
MKAQKERTNRRTHQDDTEVRNTCTQKVYEENSTHPVSYNGISTMSYMNTALINLVMGMVTMANNMVQNMNPMHTMGYHMMMHGMSGGVNVGMSGGMDGSFNTGTSDGTNDYTNGGISRRISGVSVTNNTSSDTSSEISNVDPTPSSGKRNYTKRTTTTTKR